MVSYTRSGKERRILCCLTPVLKRRGTTTFFYRGGYADRGLLEVRRGGSGIGVREAVLGGYVGGPVDV